MRISPWLLFCLSCVIVVACAESSSIQDKGAAKEVGMADLVPGADQSSDGIVDLASDAPADADAKASDAADGMDMPGDAQDLTSPDLPIPDTLIPDTLAPDTGPPSIDRCANAKLLKLVDGKVSEQGDTSALTDEFPLMKCGGTTPFAGPQAYYYVFLSGGESYKVSVTPSGMDAYLYIFSPVAFCKEKAIEQDCSSGGSTGNVSSVIKQGNTGEIYFKVPTSGFYYVAVDSASASQAGKFTLAVELECSKFDDKCNTGINLKGTCKAQPKSGSCNDEDKCTDNDICVNSGGLGICQGTPKTCPGNQCNTGKCDKTTGFCVNVPLSGSVKCDDNDKCSENDTCQAGVCKGSPMDCSPFTDTCNTGICNSGTGKCMKVAKSGTIKCDDTDKCTDNDICSNGVCKGSAKVCAGDQCNSGTCDKSSGTCKQVYKAGGCNDSNPCTLNDTCADVSGKGVCQGTAKVCAGDQCNTSTCDKSTGNCKKLYKAGTCNDGKLCSVSAKCVNVGGEGQCQGTAKVCPGDQCNTGTCDSGTGKCKKVYKAGGCNDGLACTLSDTCKSMGGEGKCEGTAKTCAGDQCNTGYCEASTGKCKKAYRAGGCSDGKLCTLSDTCQNVGGVGVCQGTAKTCAGDQCNTGYCDSGSGGCRKAYKAGGCNDGQLCTLNDVCKMLAGVGYCEGTSKTCPLDQCNTGVCNPSTGLCIFKTGPCFDGNMCTLNDTCQGGVCVPGAAKSCPSDQCNTGLCNATTGNCIFKTGSCEDGNLCTVGDVCSYGACIPGTLKTCAGDQCNYGLCNTSTGGCYKAYKAGSCSDAYGSCTSGDTCASSGGVGYCKSGSWLQDGYENNNSCGGHSFGQFTESGSWYNKSARISPTTDVDWFYVRAIEDYHWCFPGTSQSYYFRVRVYVPSGRSYQVCLRKGSCGGSITCAQGGGTLNVSYKVSGTCTLSDDTTAYWYIRAIDGKTQCQTYSFAYHYN